MMTMLQQSAVVPPASANAAQMLVLGASAHASAPALFDGGEAVGYGQLLGRAWAVAAALAGAGVEPGDRVGIYLRRDADAAAALFGVLAAGAVAVIVNETLRSRQVSYMVDHVDARMLLTSAEMLRRLAPLGIDTPLLNMADVPAAGDWTPVPRVVGDVAQIIYTSGSTGMPKGVTLSHGNLWAGVRSVVTYLGITRSDRIASLLPLSFDYGLNQLLCSVTTGASLVIERSPVPQRVVRTLRDQAITVLAAVPPLWLQLLGVDDFVSRPLPALRMMTNTGGHLPKEAVRTLRRSQGHADLVLMYGLTEAFRSCYLAADRVDAKPGSIGRAIPGAEVLLLNDRLERCGVGEIGQLVHRGPTVALGYWNDPEATAQRFRPHPLRPQGAPDAERVVFSGDFMYQDGDGDLYFVGRQDTMIKTLGYRVSPDEIVDALYSSDEVSEVVVSSEPDPTRGSRIIAYVVLKPSGSLERLQAFATRELPRYMQPARFELRQALKRTPSGKHDTLATQGSTDDSR